MVWLVLCLAFVAGTINGALRVCVPDYHWGAWALGLVAGLVWLGLSGPAGGRCDQRPGLRRAIFALAMVSSCIGHIRAVSALNVTIWTPPAQAPAQPGLQEFEVIGASRPGPQCRVLLRDPVSKQRWLADLAPAPCVYHQPQVLLVPPSAIDKLDRSWPTARELRLVTTDSADPSRPSLALAPASAEFFRGHGRIRIAVAWLKHGDGADSLAASYWRWVASMRARARDAVGTSESRALVVGSVLGLRALVSAAAVSDLGDAGLGHLLAVSGVHVALVARLVAPITLRCATFLRVPFMATLPLTWLCVACYVACTGAAPSSVRAAGMVMWAGVGAAIGRPLHGPTHLFTIVAIMLVYRPAWIIDLGFQLSVVAMWILIFRRLGSGTPDPHGDGVSSAGGSVVLDLMLQTWHLIWGMSALVCWHFGRVGFAGVLANVSAIPVFAVVVLPAGLLACVLDGELGQWSMMVAAKGAQLILDIGHIVGGLGPWAHPAWLSVGLAWHLWEWAWLGLKRGASACGQAGWVIWLAGPVGRRCAPPMALARWRPALWCVCAWGACRLWGGVDGAVPPAWIVVVERGRTSTAWHAGGGSWCVDRLPSRPERWLYWLPRDLRSIQVADELASSEPRWAALARAANYSGIELQTSVHGEGERCANSDAGLRAWAANLPRGRCDMRESAASRSIWRGSASPALVACWSATGTAERWPTQALLR